MFVIKVSKEQNEKCSNSFECFFSMSSQAQLFQSLFILSFLPHTISPFCLQNLILWNGMSSFNSLKMQNGSSMLPSNLSSYITEKSSSFKCSSQIILWQILSAPGNFEYSFWYSSSSSLLKFSSSSSLFLASLYFFPFF